MLLPCVFSSQSFAFRCFYNLLVTLYNECRRKTSGPKKSTLQQPRKVDLSFTIYNLILHHPVNIQEKYNGAAYLYAFGNIYHSHSIIFANLTFFHSFCTALADIIQAVLFPLFFNAYYQCDIFFIQIQSLCTKLRCHHTIVDKST